MSLDGLIKMILDEKIKIVTDENNAGGRDAGECRT